MTTLSNNTAFTLIELLVTLVILTIIATIAIPTYQQYKLEAKINAMYTAATAAKAVVTTDWYNAGSCSNSNYSYNTTTATPQFLKPTTYISNISVANGIITITGNSTKLYNNAINLIIKPTIDDQGQINWTCCVSSSSFFNYVPLECRNNTTVCTTVTSNDC